jgi:hypothetical protein
MALLMPTNSPLGDGLSATSAFEPTSMRKVITSLERHTIAHSYVVGNRKKYVYNALVYDRDVFLAYYGVVRT